MSSLTPASATTAFAWVRTSPTAVARVRARSRYATALSSRPSASKPAPMLPDTVAMPAVSWIARVRASARCHTVIAAVGPSRPYAAMPVRRTLSTQTLLARCMTGQAANRSTSRTRNESRHPTAYAAAR